MDNHEIRIFTTARIVALSIIALLVSGLVYFRIAPGSDSVSVPKGAKAGDLTLEGCKYKTSDGTYDADCGTLVVPENRKNPQTRLIALPVTRIRSLSAQPGDPVFWLEGGPGSTNMQFPHAGALAVDRDVVLVGYRGVDGSSVLNCPEVDSALTQGDDFLGEKFQKALSDAYRDCARRLTDDGVDLAGYSLAQRIDDFEAARQALGYGRINLYSESAGTRMAMIYPWRYPTSIHRSVMIGVNPPGHYFWDDKATNDQLARYAELCAEDPSCRKRTDDLVASMKRTAADMPDRWGFLRIKESNVRIAAFYGLFETASKVGPVSAPMTLDSWLSAAEGDPSGLWLGSMIGDFAFAASHVWGEFAATGFQDARVADAYFKAPQDPGSVLGNPGSDFLWGGGQVVGAWPLSPDDAEYSKVRTSKVETLLVSGELDFTTPPQFATQELLPYLPNGHEVVVPGTGHTGSFWNDQPEGTTRLINTFFGSGRVDDSLFKSVPFDFTPSSTHTKMAKVIAGSMVGTALLAAASLLLMAVRVQRKGRFGPKAAALLRSVFLVVLGLGGWFLGALIVLSTMPGVPLTSELLASFGVGLPVGLGVYLAWVSRDASRTTKTVGLAGAIAGSLVGGWLGFHATEGLIALVTTIIGSAVAANLVVLFLDMARDRQARDQAAMAGGTNTPGWGTHTAGAATELAVHGGSR